MAPRPLATAVSPVRDDPMFRHAVIAGKFAPFHKGHQLLVATAQAESRRVTVLAHANPDFPTMPSPRRAEWSAALHPCVRVHVPEGAPPDASPDRVRRAFVAAWVGARGFRVDAVLSSWDYGPGFAASLGAAHRMVDRHRRQVPISGRFIRADPEGQAAFLDPLVLGDLRRG